MANDVAGPRFLPEFANTDNRKLAADVERLQEHLELANYSLLDNTDTIVVLHEHLRRIQRDVQLASQKLVNLSRDFCTDEHKHQMELRHLVRMKKKPS